MSRRGLLRIGWGNHTGQLPGLRGGHVLHGKRGRVHGVQRRDLPRRDRRVFGAELRGVRDGGLLGRGRGDVRELRRRLLPGDHRVRGLRDVRARGLLEHGRRLVRELRRRHLPKYPWASVVRQLRRRHLLGLRRSALHEVRGGFIYGCDCFHGVHELQSGHLFDGLRGDCFVRLRKLPCRRVFRPCSFSVLSVRCRDLCCCCWCHELRELPDGYVFDLGRRGLHDVRGGQVFLGPRGFKLH
jgi:hypothetical protein